MARQRKRYAEVLIKIYEKKFDPNHPDAIIFTQQDLRDAATELGINIRNFPDLIYYLRSRAKVLPEVITVQGFKTIASKGRGVYAITKELDKIDIPENIEVIEISSELIPTAIRDILRVDEQSILSAIRYAKIISLFLDCECYHLQGHLRTTGSLGQEVEADEVYIAVVDKETFTRAIVPIEAKGVNEQLGLSQIRSIIDAVRKKIPGFNIIPLGAKLRNDGKLLILRFDFQTSEELIEELLVVEAKYYVFKPPLPNWPPT